MLRNGMWCNLMQCYVMSCNVILLQDPEVCPDFQRVSGQAKMMMMMIDDDDDDDVDDDDDDDFDIFLKPYKKP